MVRTSIVLCIIGFIWSGICIAQTPEIKNIDKPNDIYIYDYENVFTDEEEEILSKIIIRHKEQTKKEIIVVTTPSIGDFSNILEYATNLGSVYSNEIKNENVVTIAASKTLRKIAIATSPKAREILTDTINTTILNNVIIPKIKKGYFFKAIRIGICEIIEKWKK